MDGPTGSTKAVSHIEGASLVIGLNLDQLLVALIESTHFLIFIYTNILIQKPVGGRGKKHSVLKTPGVNIDISVEAIFSQEDEARNKSDSYVCILG